jgi:hypothetical protein
MYFNLLNYGFFTDAMSRPDYEYIASNGTMVSD